MKIKFIVFVIFICFNFLWGFSSKVKKISNGFEINIHFPETEYLLSYVNGFTKYDFIFNGDESKPGYPKLPSRIIFVAIPPEAKVNVKLVDKHTVEYNNALIEINPEPIFNDSLIEYKSIDPDLSIYQNGFYPSNEIEIIDYIWIRDFYCAVIKINTHRYSFFEKKLLIIDSLKFHITFNEFNLNYLKNNQPFSIFDDILKDIIINFDYAKEFRSFNTTLTYHDTTGQWIDYTKEYLKLAIPSDNIYRITYNDLVSYGVNPDQINPKTFKLFFKGKEQPIFVSGEDDNIFDSEDYIEFYAEKNYTYQDYRRIVQMGQDYIQYLNRYSDTSIVWLTWNGNFGKRISQLNQHSIPALDTIDSHLVKIHLEQDVRLWYYDPVTARVQLPFWQENKTWTWLVVGNSGSTSVNFNARDFLPNTPVTVIARLISYAASGNQNAHKHALSLNSTTPLDTLVYNYRQTVNLTGNYSSSRLVNGNNIVRIFGLPTQATFHQSLIDWVDIDYYRQNVTINDSLKIIIPDSVTRNLRTIKISNVLYPDSILIYKIKPEYKKIINFNIVGSSPSTLFFVDTVGGGDQYYITRISKVSKPVLKNKKYFINLRNPLNGADYILISSRILSTSVNEYKNFISSNYNIRVELIYDDDIYDEFSFGMTEAEAIKSFLKVAYSSWTAPKPSFLTLIGDANYDYKDVVTPAPTPRKKNIVTSFGNPVSDVWYVMWDSVNLYFPQMFVGRIPANNNEQVSLYLQKHQKYLNRRFDVFNKSYLFFSGGDANKPSELAQIKATNDYLMSNFILSNPLFGNANHFYKTINPPSNFGPYSLEYVQNAIDEGGTFVSYIGHSGTRTWDNSITEVEHLKNKYNDRFPLITDFGCSTGKFAEPDVDAFGELFICQSPNGQAIAYLGNSSWGYLSTSLRFPKYFYEILTRDSLKGIGRAHTLAKIRQLNETGMGDVNLVFTYCNLLLGDPIIGLKIPEKPNFSVNENNIKLLTPQPNDQLDSTKFQVVITNLGIVNNDSLNVQIEDVFRDSIIYSQRIVMPFTKFKDTLEISIPVGNFIGQRTFRVIIDPENNINEIYEDDNEVSFDYLINSTSLRTLEVSEYYNTYKDTIEILNPLIKKTGLPERLIMQLSTTKDFNQVRTIVKEFDTLLTKVPIYNLLPNQRYYYRMKIDEPDAFWGEILSFQQKRPEFKFYIDEELNPEDFLHYQTKFDTVSKSWRLNTEKITLKILSAGGHDGAFGSIQLNGYEQLPNTYYWGLATAFIDSLTLRPYNIKYFNVPDPGVRDSLANYVNNLPENTLIAMTISADAVQNILAGRGSNSRNAIKTLGSLYIDSIQYREGWCILGRKGASIGSVPEDYRKLFAGVAQIEISKNLNYDSGYIVFPEIKFSSKWGYILVETEKPLNTNIYYLPIGIRKNGQQDTLYQYQTNRDSIDLTSLDATIYPSLKLMAKLYANERKESPKIYSVGIKYTPISELAVNYQTVTTNVDSIYQGESILYKARIFNVGQSSANNFRINLDLIRDDNSSYNLIDTVVNELNAGNFVDISYNYINKIYDGYGNFSFKLSIDPDNSVYEFYKNNNLFYKSFYVKKDTTTSVNEAQISVLFNGRIIRDWEFVEPDAKIEIVLNYPVWFPVYDTSAVQIFIDGQRYYSHQLVYDYDTIERKINIILDKKFSKGEHNLRIFVKDAYGKISTQPIVDRYFKVTSELEIYNVYNYPNPFSSETYFTFVLTQVPDELLIKIYTVAGRLIKELRLSHADLTTNFNKVLWDGKDEDGDFVGNGVYLYKIIAKKADKVQTVIQKLAVVR